MNGDSETASLDIESQKSEGAGGGRQRSTIGFPYMDLNDAMEVARAIHENVGQGDCSEDQLAAWLRVSSKSSSFRAKLSTARMFGLIEGSNPNIGLTSLGRQIVDPNQVRAARVQAFLNVPLYRAVFEKYQGGVLPPAAAFERDIVGIGVAEKQKSKARQVFERSANQAGYFEHGKDRLVQPGIVEDTGEARPPSPDTGEGGGGGANPPDLHPFVQGLIEQLPKPNSEWPVDEQVKWLQTAASIFGLMYKSESKGGVTVNINKNNGGVQ